MRACVREREGERAIVRACHCNIGVTKYVGANTSDVYLVLPAVHTHVHVHVHVHVHNYPMLILRSTQTQGPAHLPGRRTAATLSKTFNLEKSFW